VGRFLLPFLWLEEISISNLIVRFRYCILYYDVKNCKIVLKIGIFFKFPKSGRYRILSDKKTKKLQLHYLIDKIIKEKFYYSDFNNYQYVEFL